ncbi:MAG: hypothetical protein H5U07_01525 [Candidatus Aminicenantes bacterium]|nr:hypothetical protein [Candidatus Aminicenantes bacterium]
MGKNQKQAWLRIFFNAWFFSWLFLLVLAACQQETKWPGLAVNVQFSERELTDYLVTKLQMKFITTSDFRVPGEAWKIIAEAEYDKQLIFQDEFNLQPSIENWLPEHVYESEKYVFIPAFIDKFNPQLNRGVRLNFRVYAENDKKEKILLYQRVLKLKPYPLEIPDVLYLDGWERIIHPGPSDRLNRVELWTSEKAICLIRNPGKPSRLMLKGECLAPAGEKQSLFIDLNGRLLDTLQLERGPFQIVYELSAEDLGKEREIRLTLTVDKVFQPEIKGSEEQPTNELGLKIFTVYLRPKQ